MKHGRKAVRRQIGGGRRYNQYRESNACDVQLRLFEKIIAFVC
ncbi:hypothetical protein [Bacillus siamensis]|nr:hypothetical protein [Bacillus siamensis]